MELRRSHARSCPHAVQTPCPCPRWSANAGAPSELESQSGASLQCHNRQSQQCQVVSSWNLEFLQIGPARDMHKICQSVRNVSNTHNTQLEGENQSAPQPSTFVHSSSFSSFTWAMKTRIFLTLFFVFFLALFFHHFDLRQGSKAKLGMLGQTSTRCDVVRPSWPQCGRLPLWYRSDHNLS